MKTLARPRYKAEILQRLRLLRPDSVHRWGRMSAHQMVCHLNDSFLVATGEKTASPSTGPLQRSIVKWIALYFPVRWPAGVPTRPEIDQQLGGTRPVDFAVDLAQLEALVDLVTTERGSFRCKAHPIFGPMSEPAWFRWAYLHMDHHLRQFGA